MNVEIMARKARLAERIANQREQLAGRLESLQPLLRIADGGVSAARAIRAHPEWAALAAGVFVVLRPRRTLVWLRRGFWVWRSWKWAKRTLSGALADGVSRN